MICAICGNDILNYEPAEYYGDGQYAHESCTKEKNNEQEFYEHGPKDRPEHPFQKAMSKWLRR